MERGDSSQEAGSSLSVAKNKALAPVDHAIALVALLPTSVQLAICFCVCM